VTGAGTVRLFFAAWPGPGIQQALHDAARQAQGECGGRAIAARNLHLTLAFLGNIERTRVDALEALAAGISGAPCDLAICRVDHFKKSRIVWAGVERCPEPLEALVAALSAALRALDIRVDERPYVPHITLVRDARRKPERTGVAPIVWSVQDFALVESLQRGKERVYEVRRRWALRSDSI
jgi:2'-5' RNA ligase